MRVFFLAVLIFLSSLSVSRATSDQDARLARIRGAAVAGLDSLAPSYLADQNREPGSIRRGQFHHTDNMRVQEVTLVLSFLYREPLSRYHGNSKVLESALLSLDYMVRAQGSNGGFNETAGWCGVPDRLEGKSSVTGFTIHAIGRSVALLAGDKAFEGRLKMRIDTDGDSKPDTDRRTAYLSMFERAMPMQFEGNGRGHAPNQDVAAWAAVVDLNGAYQALRPGAPPLKTARETRALRNEVLSGKWFTGKGMLLEPGHGGAGYDANYAGVTLHFAGMVARNDPSVAAYVSRLWEGLQYFFVVEPDGPKIEMGTARRVTKDDFGSITPCYAGLTARFHPAANRVYSLALERFEADPASYFKFPSPHQLQFAAYSYVDWLLNLALPKESDYRLPCERREPFRYEDQQAGILAVKPEGGHPTWWARPWDAPDQVRRHRYGEKPATLPSSEWPSVTGD